MKREEILFYMATDKVYLYLVNSKHEKIVDLDTSLFFRFGEIYDIETCSKTITELLLKMNFGTFYLKPNMTILYNNVCRSDIKFLYRYAIRELECNNINFVPLKTVLKMVRDDENLVFFDENYYTLINKEEKCAMEQIETYLDFEPVLVGKSDTIHLHYADEDIVWRTFKTYFTNR